MSTGSPLHPSDPTTPTERFRSARQRIGAAQKTLDGVPAYLRYVNRKLGGLIAAAGFAVGATPNQITAVSAALSAAGIALVATVDVGVPGAVGVALLLALGFAFDSGDGQLARLRGGGSPSGEWLDHVVDVAKTSALHAVVAIAWYRYYDLDARFGSRAWLLVPLGFWIVSVTYVFAMQLRDQLRKAAGAPKTAPKADPRTTPDATAAAAGTGARGGVLRSVLLLPIDYGLLCVSFVLLGTHAAFLAVYSALFALNLAFTAYSLSRCFVQLSALPRAGSAAAPLTRPVDAS